MLEAREAADVAEAIRRLGKHSRRHTAGHLVGQLGFGFWIRLCDSPYEQGRANGPGLWPTAAKRFPNCPRTERTRVSIRYAFDELRELRNRIAHHQPIWEPPVLDLHERAIQRIGWMNLKLAAVTAHHSRFRAVYDAGPAAWRPVAEASVCVAD